MTKTNARIPVVVCLGGILIYFDAAAFLDKFMVGKNCFGIEAHTVGENFLPQVNVGLSLE